MSGPVEREGTYGYLALVQLVGSMATDQRLPAATRQAVSVLATFAGPDGSCCVSVSRVAERLGITRQAAQQALLPAERAGYFTSERRQRKTGAEGAKVFHFNLELAGAVACPVRWPIGRREKGDKMSGFPEGVQAPELAGGCKYQSLQGVQAPELAHKKPSEDTRNEETNARSASALMSGKRHRGGTTARPASERHSGQQPLLLPISGGASQAPLGERVKAAVAAHNHEQRQAVSGRIMQQWFRLDGEELHVYLSDAFDDVLERAITAEQRERGAGVRYIAGAVARASGGEVEVADIMAGRHAISFGSA